MSYAIAVEVQFFIISILWGALILLAYDFLRIFRRIIKHNTIAVAIQDILFWVTAGVFIFAMIYKENDGIIRGFSVMGMSIGMVLYHYLLSGFLVKTITKIIQTLLKPLVMAINMIKKVCRSIWRKFEGLIKFVGKRLKSRMKSVKIAVNSKRKIFLAKHQKKVQQKAAEQKKKKQLRQRAEKPTPTHGANTQKEPAASARIDASKAIPARKPKVNLSVKPDSRNTGSTADKLRKVH